MSTSEQSTIIFKNDAASLIQVKNILSTCSDQYVPNLHCYVNIPEYAKKLFAFSSRFEAFSSNNLISLVAIYCNDPLKKEAFISNVCTHPKGVGQGIASALLDLGIKRAALLGFNLITLEVHSESHHAIGLYQKKGFKKTIEKFNKIKMEMRLSNDK